MGDTFAELARTGPLVIAIATAALAGLVSFLSPCVLPLVPGYLSYVTGLAGADLDRSAAASRSAASRSVASAGGVAVATRPRPWIRGRVLAGTVLFVVGFAVTFTALAILFATIGKALFTHQRTLEIVVGAVIIVLGLAFLGLVPGLQREVRIKRLPEAGLLGAPVFGAVFALSWIPCTGPTLGAVLGLASASGQTDRAVVLALSYCLGLGIPFIVFGLFFERLLGLFKAIRRNSRWVTRVGGVLLIAVGLALVTGAWNQFLIWLQTSVGVGSVGI
jgi:cytochrome c-type biogenesis protein